MPERLCTTLARTLLDLAEVVDPRALERAIGAESPAPRGGSAV
jgi:hypothetical protein